MRQHISATQYKIVRVTKDVPCNKRSGDFGVYVMKMIECLAIGCNFEGTPAGLVDLYSLCTILDYVLE